MNVNDVVKLAQDMVELDQQLKERETAVTQREQAIAKTEADLVQAHNERCRVLEARERGLNDVRQLAAQRKAEVERAREAEKQAIEEKRKMQARVTMLEAEVARIEMTLGDTLRRRSV